MYKAAAQGNVEPFKDMAENEIMSLVTVINNTILHINITAQAKKQISSTTFAEKMLVICPSLLLQVNARGNTPLHVAAKYDHVDMVKILIETAKSQHNDEDDVKSGTTSCRQMIKMLNNDKNTALHEAVCCGSLDIVKILVKEVSEFPYSANSYGETPLYMAAARRFSNVVVEILEKCPSPAHQGPRGKTALHAAVISNSSAVLIEQLVERKKSLIRNKDGYGWTPLHYAAYFDRILITKQLLEYDRSAANIVDKYRRMTPLHLAAARKHEDIVNLIISNCPESCEMVDARGWNVLHFAVVSFNDQQLKKLMEKPFVENLINEKDVNGSTPLHVVAAIKPLSAS